MKKITLISIFIISLVCSLDCRKSSKPIIVVDVDAGADDAVAILLLLEAHKRGDIELKAITCVAGNTKLDNVATNVLRLLEAASALDIAIYKGAEEGLVPDSDYNLNESVWHGVDGFGDLDYNGHFPDISQIKPEHAVNAIYRLVSEQPQKVTVIFLGPLTNAALALKMHPKIIELVKDIFVMGGNYRGVGNKSNAAEFNFGMDPEAAYLLLGKMKKHIVIFPWETCLELNIDVGWRFNEMGDIDTPEMKLLNAVEKSIQEMHNSTTYLACDSAGVAVMLNPQIITESITTHASIELGGRLTRGQMVLDHNGLNEPNVKIVTKMDVEVFKTMLMFAAGHNGAGS